MKKLILSGILLSTSFLTNAQKATDNFAGKWQTPEGKVVEISKSGAVFTGKPVGKNVVVLKDLTFTGNKWIGVLTNPLKNVTANCEATLEGDKLKFIAKKGLFSKEIFWVKAN
jgi:hypothetical protein